MTHRVRKADLAGAELQQEGCLTATDEDGTTYLTHLQADVWDKANGEWLGSIVFNGEIRLPLGLFEWHQKQEKK